MIAFTSQMAHVVSNAYIKSPTAGQHKGFSAGSYKDMTRVAWLSPEMWAELFLENKDNLLQELDIFMAHLGEYRDAMAARRSAHAARACWTRAAGARRRWTADDDHPRDRLARI